MWPSKQIGPWASYVETYTLNIKAYERQPIILLLDPKSSMPPVWSLYTQANINKVEKV